MLVSGKAETVIPSCFSEPNEAQKDQADGGKNVSLVSEGSCWRMWPGCVEQWLSDLALQCGSLASRLWPC